MKIRWSKRASADREDIYQTIRKDSIQAAIEMDERIWNAIISLTGFPQLGRAGRVAGTRELVVKNYPYIIAYIVERDAIRVVGIRHGARLWPKAMPKL